jgi:hypothetical protein
MGRRLALGALVAVWAAFLVALAPLVFAVDSSAPSARQGSGRDAAARGSATGAIAGPASSRPTTADRLEHSTKPGRGEISIAWAGDITPGSRYGQPPNQGRSLFQNVRGLLARADVAVGNLEGTLSSGGVSKCGTDGGKCFSFQAPPESAAALKWAGFDVMNMANNHSFDFGATGQQQTVTALEGNGIAHAGLPGRIAVLRRRGIRIATVGFAPYPWASDLRDLAAVRELVRRADALAELVVVLAHLGAEGADQTHVPVGREFAMGEDRGDTRAFAQAAVEAGADLVLGSGPHVLRGIALYRGKLIAYSLGNFAGWHNFSSTGLLSLSGLLTVRLSPKGHLRGGAFAGLRLSGAGIPTPDSSGEARALLNRLSREDFGGSALQLLPDGSF